MMMVIGLGALGYGGDAVHTAVSIDAYPATYKRPFVRTTRSPSPTAKDFMKKTVASPVTAPSATAMAPPGRS